MKFLSTILLLAFLLMVQHIAAQKTITWQEGLNLKWDDFQGKPDSNSHFLTVTSSGIVWSYAYKSGVFSFTAKSVFYCAKSWKKNTVAEWTIKHEQGHFDITEIFARRLKAKVDGMSHARTYFEREIEKIADKLIADKDTMQRQYDKETEFGAGHSHQQKWQEKIEGELAGLKKWAL